MVGAAPVRDASTVVGEQLADPSRKDVLAAEIATDIGSAQNAR